MCIILREAFKKKKTAIIVTLSLPGGRGVSQNPYNKSNYYRDIDLWRGVSKPRIPYYNLLEVCRI